MKVILPNFYNNYAQTNILIDGFNQQHNLIIGGVYGNFPFSFFRSENNSFIDDELALFRDMSQSLQGYNKFNYIILDFANPLIEKKDYHNNFCKIQMESFADKKNIYIAVGQQEFAEYLSSNYPYVKLILNLDFMEFNSQLKNIVGVISSNIDKLQNFNHLLTIYKLPIYNCIFCNYNYDCKKCDHQAMLEYSSKSIFYDCNNLQLLSVQDIEHMINIATQANVDMILFEPLKNNVNEYYEHIVQVLKEGENND